MDFVGSYKISATREEVWRGLNDPAVLQAAIPGCEELSEAGEDGFAAVIVAKLGPVKAKFKGAVKLENQTPPESYRLVGEGKGGVAGFGKGAADVTLHETAGGTLLEYRADAKIGGKIAQLGARLIKGAVKKLADDFFLQFAQEIGAQAEPTPGDAK